MLWEITIFPAPQQPDIHGKTLIQDARDLGLSHHAAAKTAYGYLLELQTGNANNLEKITDLAKKLLADPVVEQVEVAAINHPLPPHGKGMLEVPACSIVPSY